MIILLLTAAGVILAEVLIKRRLETEKLPKALARGRVELRIAHNPGLILGFLKTRQALANILSGCALLGVFIYSMARCTRGLSLAAKLGWGLILGGGLSNLLDRLLHGHVTDYVTFPRALVKKLRRVVFNTADFCVFLGALLAAVFDR